MSDNISKEYSVNFVVNKDDIDRDFDDSQWENFKKILESNTQSYIERCLWILKQIKE